MEEHQFKYNGEWIGGLYGKGSFSAGALSHEISIPKEMNGPGIGTNPEELLVSAAGSCYLITLAAILQFQRVAFKKLTVVSNAIFIEKMGPELKSIEHQVVVYGAVEDVSQKEKIEQSIKQAENKCMVSVALRGNVSITAKGSLLILES